MSSSWGIEALGEHDATCDVQRVVDLHIPFGIETDLGVDDEWPAVHAQVMASDILVIATPTWLGQPSSIAKLVLERLNALMGETHDDGTPVAFNKVAGVVVTGNEDGAHHVISEVNGGLVDIGFTIPGQAWTYWHMGLGPGPLVHRDGSRPRVGPVDGTHDGCHHRRGGHRPSSPPDASALVGATA